MPSPINNQPQAGTSVPESFLPSEAGAGLTVVVLLVIEVVWEGAAAGLVSVTVAEGPGTVTVRVCVEVTVSVDVQQFQSGLGGTSQMSEQRKTAALQPLVRASTDEEPRRKLVELAAGVVLPASALTVQASATPAHSATPDLNQNQRLATFTVWQVQVNRRFVSSPS